MRQVKQNRVQDSGRFKFERFKDLGNRPLISNDAASYLFFGKKLHFNRTQLNDIKLF